MKFAKADAYHAIALCEKHEGATVTRPLRANGPPVTLVDGKECAACGGYTITTEPGLYMAWRAHRHARGRELLSHHHYPPDDRQARIDALRAAERACEMDASHAR